MKCLNSLDSFGYSINFTVNSNDKYKSAFGGILSIASGFIWVILFFIFGQNCFLKQNPTGYSQIKPSVQSVNSLELYDNPFLFGLQIAQNDWKILNIDEYFYPIFSFSENDFQSDQFSWNRTFLKAIPCNQVKINNEIDIKYFNLSSFLCPDFSSIKEKSLKGTIDDGKFTVIDFFLRLCDENNSNCKSKKKIEELKKRTKTWINTINPIVEYNINNITNSLISKIHFDGRLFNPFGYSFDELHYSRYKSETDLGDFFKDIETELGFGLSEIKRTSDANLEIPEKDFDKKNDISTDENNLYQMSIFFQNKEFYYSRWYMKVPDILAQTGGMIKIIMTMMSILYSFYSKFMFNSFLCENLLFIDDESEEIKENMRKYFYSKNIIENNNEKKGFKESDISGINDNNNNQNIINIINKNQSDNTDAKPVENVRDRYKQKRKQSAKENCLKYLEMKETNRKSQNMENSLRVLVGDQEKEKIRSQLESILNKFSASKNSFNFRIPLILLCSICPKRYPNESKNRRIIRYFGEKINEKFDIFYYFRQDKSNKIIENILMSKEQIGLKDLISRKNYSIKIQENGFEENVFNKKEENQLIAEYLLSSEIKMERSDKILLENINL